MINLNRHIMMSEAEKEEVIGTITGAVKEHDVDASNTFIGGLSSAGHGGVPLGEGLLPSAAAPGEV